MNDSNKIFEKFTQKDFDRARSKSFFNALSSYFKREENQLLSFEDVKKAVRPVNQVYKGVKSIPIENIRGSENRYNDFDKEFLPKQDTTRTRWENVDKAFYEQIELPPIQVYQIGDIYFVKDGNHRVSVAKEQGKKYIDAEIIELKSKVPLDKDVDYEELILKEEYVNFLEITHLDSITHDLFEVTKPGRFDLIIEHIKLHKKIIESLLGKEIDWDYAVRTWYKSHYMPVKAIIKKYHIMKHFPDLTETDLFIWIIGHWNYLRSKYNANIDSEQAAIHLKEKYSRKFLYRVKKGFENFFKFKKAVFVIVVSLFLFNFTNSAIIEPQSPHEPIVNNIAPQEKTQPNNQTEKKNITLYPFNASLIFQDNTILNGLISFPEKEIELEHIKNGFLYKKTINWGEVKNLQITRWEPSLNTPESNAKTLTYYFYPKEYKITLTDDKVFFYKKNIPYLNQLLLTNDEGSTYIYSYFVDYWQITGKKSGHWKIAKSTYFPSTFYQAK